MKKDIYLIEDCIPLNGVQSIFIKKHIDKRSTANFLVIGWKEAGWSTKPRSIDRDEITDYSRYFPNATCFGSKDFQNLNCYLQGFKGYEKVIQFFLASYNKKIDINILREFKYRGCRVGHGIVSTILRHDLNIYCNQNVDIQVALNLLHASCRAVDILFTIGALYNLKSFYCSETVYQSIPLIDASLMMSASCPLLLDPGFPCEITARDMHYSAASGISERILASTCAKLGYYKASKPNEARIYKEAHNIAGKNTSSNSEFITTDFLYRYLSKKVFLETKDIIDLKNIAAKNKVCVILHLHAVTDGPFFVGYSGFISPYHYFVHFLQQMHKASLMMTESLDRIHIVIKPHPNILTGSSSQYKSHHLKAQGEKKVSSFIFKSLVQLIKDLGFNVSTVSTSLSSEELLNLPNAVHVTHHGAISLEATLKNRMVITTKISPASLLRSNQNILFLNGFEDQKKLSVFFNKILDIDLKMTNILDENSQTLAACDRYYGEYRSRVNNLYKIALKTYGIDLDSLIISKRLSFCMNSQLPSDLKDHFRKLEQYQP